MKRIREYGIIPGEMTPGPLNKITDVAGVTVGHATISTAAHKTGVTMILPCQDNPYSSKLTAAEAVEEAILNSLAMAETTVGYQGKTRYSLTDVWLSHLSDETQSKLTW